MHAFGSEWTTEEGAISNSKRGRNEKSRQEPKVTVERKGRALEVGEKTPPMDSLVGQGGKRKQAQRGLAINEIFRRKRGERTRDFLESGGRVRGSNGTGGLKMTQPMSSFGGESITSVGKWAAGGIWGGSKKKSQQSHASQRARGDQTFFNSLLEGYPPLKTRKRGSAARFWGKVSSLGGRGRRQKRAKF